MKFGKTQIKSLKEEIAFLKAESKALRHALLVEKQMNKDKDQLIDTMMIDYAALNHKHQGIKKALDNNVPKVMQRRLKDK